MENDQQVTCSSTEMDDEHPLLLQLSEKDPLFEKKKKLLEAVSIDAKECIYFKGTYSVDAINSIFEGLLQLARIICFDEVDLYFAVSDIIQSVVFHSARNELEALNLILSLLDKSMLNSKHLNVDFLEHLRNITISKINALGDRIKEKTEIVGNHSCDRETCLLQWGETEGVKTKLEIAFVAGAGRGAIAREHLNVGDIALEIPITVIMSEELVHDSDMFPILKKVDGITYETMLLLWSMKEKHNCNSKFKLYFDTLPKEFNTGLSFGVDALMELDGTLLLEEIVQAKEHLRSQYAEFFPSLCNGHPDIFPQELYTWEQFLWACELWYSNSMKVMFPDGKLKTCLTPIAGFLNHSISPHIVHYGKVDSTSSCLKFPVSRPCNAGEQCFLSYGKFSSSHLVTFYGFLPHEDNPYDVIPLDIDVPEIGGVENGNLMSNWTTHMVRGTWFSKNHEIFHYGLPSPLLDQFRRARAPTLHLNTVTQENLEIELEVLSDLLSTFEEMMQVLCSTEYRENGSWDVKLASKFKDSQRKIFSSIITSCKAGFKLVEVELSKTHGLG